MRWKIAVGIAILTATFEPADSAGICADPGWVPMSVPQKCMPPDAVDCGEGHFCAHGYTCDLVAKVCEPGSEVLAQQKAEQRKQFRDTRRAMEAQSRSGSATRCTNTLLAPGAWAWASKCVASGPHKAADHLFMQKSAGELATALNNPSIIQLLPPMETRASLPRSPQESPAASQSSPAPQTGLLSSSTTHWQGTSDPDDCAHANGVEKSSAYWGYMCVPAQSTSGYRPSPDPKILSARAREVCGSWSRETRQCYGDTKLKIVLEQNPAIRDACAAANAGTELSQQLHDSLGVEPRDTLDTPFNRCVDDAYLYGPQGPPTPPDTLRNLLRQRDAADGGEQSARRPSSEKLPRGVCGPGEGLKPDRSAFGRWTCQPLDLSALGGKPPADSPLADSPPAGSPPADPADNSAARFEQRVQDLTTRITAAATNRSGGQEQATCTTAAYAAALSLMKGGEPPSAPPMCNPLLNAVRAELVYYAKSRIPLDEAGVAELLAYLSIGNPNPGGSIGGHLGPPVSGEDRRIADCVVRGGVPDTCAAAVAAPSFAPPSSAGGRQ